MLIGRYQRQEVITRGGATDSVGRSSCIGLERFAQGLEDAKELSVQRWQVVNHER